MVLSFSKRPGQRINNLAIDSHHSPGLEFTPMSSGTTILGIHFFSGDLEESIHACQSGGLLLAPSGPGMADLPLDPTYRESLEGADIVIADSGLMVTVWNFFNKEKAQRISGYLFLKRLLDLDSLKKEGSTFWVMPTEREQTINLNWLNAVKGFKLTKEDCYIAPFYDNKSICDDALLPILEKKKPLFIIINIGGGIQEKLGHYLKTHLSYTPTIVCTGAAIAFMTGQQANIPMWADKLFLGWLFRIFQSPRKFLPRYWQAKKLVWLLLKYRDKSPSDCLPS